MSADNPDGLYGEDVWAVVMDEASRTKEEAFHAVRSTLTATRGPFRGIGNVKGRKNWFYAMARKAEAGEPELSYHKITAADAIAAGVLVADVGIGADEPEVRRDRHRARLQRTAVDQQRGAGDAAGGDILVHDAAAHADEFVLGALGDLGRRDRLERQAGGGEQRMGDADLERRGRAEAGAERHVARDHEVRAGEAPPVRLQHRSDPEHVVGPHVTAAGRGRVEIEFAGLVHEQGIDADRAIVARSGGDEGGEIERRRHDESVVVVGVLADQVDPAGRAAHPGHSPEAHAELLRDVARPDGHRRHGRAP